MQYFYGLHLYKIQYKYEQKKLQISSILLRVFASTKSWSMEKSLIYFLLYFNFLYKYSPKKAKKRLLLLFSFYISEDLFFFFCDSKLYRLYKYSTIFVPIFLSFQNVVEMVWPKNKRPWNSSRGMYCYDETNILNVVFAFVMFLSIS